MGTALENLLDKRSLRSSRQIDCVQNFYEKRDRATMLVEHVHKKGNREVIAEANNHYVIAIVTAFEVYMTDLINELINKKKVDPLNLNFGSKREYPFKEVIFIIKKKITVGELFCNAMNFENVNDVGLLLSSLFNIKFFDFLRNHEFRYKDNRNKNVSFTFEPDFQIKLTDIFESRHKIVHDITFKKTPTIIQLKKMGSLMTRFVHSIELLANQYRDNRDCEIVKTVR